MIEPRQTFVMNGLPGTTIEQAIREAKSLLYGRGSCILIFNDTPVLIFHDSDERELLLQWSAYMEAGQQYRAKTHGRIA